MSRAPQAWFLVSELEGQRASSFRQERWCRVFIEGGARVLIANLRGALRFGFAICDTMESFEAFRRAALARAEPMASVREGAGARILRRIKHALLMDLYYPSVIGLFASCAARLMRSPDPVVVVASSPPFSLAVCGALLKRLAPAKVKLVVDMRDAWALHTSLGGSRTLKRWIEGWVMRSADRVTTVSFGLKEEFEAAYGIRVEVLYNVATHYFDVGASPPVDWKSINPELHAGSLKLVYTGSTPEGFYDTAAIIDGIRRFRTGSPDLAKRIQIVFVGACAEVLREAERQGGCGDGIVFVPHVSHPVAKAIQQSADALVFLAYRGEGNKGVVSTKLFEYFALGKPILPITVHAGSDVDRLLSEYCGQTRHLLDANALSIELERIAANGPETLPALADPTRVRHLFEEYKRFAAQVLGA